MGTYLPPLVWPSTRNLPIRSESRKLTLRFIDQFPVSKLINLSVGRLKLPKSLLMHPLFHMSNVKPVKESSLVSASKSSLLPLSIDGEPVYAIGTVGHQAPGTRHTVHGGFGGLWFRGELLGFFKG